MAASSWDQIASEHCYPKLMAHWSSITQSLPTFHLFKPNEGAGPREEPLKTIKEEDTSQSVVKEEKEPDINSDGDDDDMEIDVVGVADTPSRPYNYHKVKNIMNECYQHMNLIRLPLENNDLELEKVFSDANYQQQNLLSKCLQVFRDDQLARLSFSGSQEEAIQRRLSNDTASKKIRKIFADIKWDPQLTQWLHRTLIRVLDDDMLPIYLDVLQVLKTNCPGLVEQMIHIGLGGDGVNEALKLLLKRPWNPSIGMTNIDKQLHFDPSPLFVTVPHSTAPLGSRRLRLFQSQFNAFGKVFPVIVQDNKADTGQRTSFRESVENIVQCTLQRVQELKEQFSSRPIILVSWSTSCRIACKVAEVERVACLVNLGLVIDGLDYSWTLSSDPFLNCTTPSIFIIGENSPDRTKETYVEELRSRMKTRTSLVVMHGGDDQLRLTSNDKLSYLITQGMIDRILIDKIYEFFIYCLPSSLSLDIKIPRKRKSGSSEEPSNSFLSSSVPNSPIVLTATAPAGPDDATRLSSLSSNPLVMRSLLGGGVKTAGMGMARSSGATPLLPSTKAPRIGRPPKLGRPRSKSSSETKSLGTTKVKGSSNISSRSRSKSGEVEPPPSPQSPPIASPANGNNSNNASPDTLLSLTKKHLCPILPITPPKPSLLIPPDTDK
ncbi:PREDICTED: KAT8 regulatory NSL complex subunit 3-like [Amphimedon queenslandica]|uniref:KANSL3 helical domain-containing protein n=1 Tax=Amphimedon queenslandica TaxID=400682 RepID=A0A1X7VKS3_AMPQE|nr:PREDICTED: KAT8 regulatory NSL complex subunit 3-like [Amphimedon queenslandica]|eukprot:XP_019864368.1 PREDICTED: KAT8 regulatory NSL complex subunit 3-like [Amphimedon queenslandica]